MREREGEREREREREGERERGGWGEGVSTDVNPPSSIVPLTTPKVGAREQRGGLPSCPKERKKREREIGGE